MKDTTAPLELLRYNDLLVLRRGTKTYGFHADKMEIARLTEEAWPALLSLRTANTVQPISKMVNEAKAELKSWAFEKFEPRYKSIYKKTEAREPSIRSITINIAQTCNLACTYCAAGGDGTYGSRTKKPDVDATKSLISNLIKWVPDNKAFAITFLGGEPLLYPEIIKTLSDHACEEALPKNIRLYFDIVTNGTLVTPQTAELLAELNAYVTVSLDGAPEENDRARITKSGQGSSKLVLKGLAELVKVKDRLGALNVGATFGKHNTEVIKAWKFLSEYPFTFIKFDFAAEIGDEEASREYARQVSETARLAYAKGGEHELRRIHTFDHLYRALDDQARIQNHCLAGKNHMQLDTSGKLTACQWFVGQKEEEFGTIDDLDLSLNNPILKGFSEPLIEKNGCSDCWARHICAGGCMHVNKVKTGNKHVKDYAYCERTKTILAYGIELYAESREQQAEQLKKRGEQDGDTSEQSQTYELKGQ